MKSLSVVASATALAGGLTTDQWLVILGFILTIVNAIIEILKKLKEKKDDE